MVERPRRATDSARSHLCIARRGVDVAMAKQRLDDADVGSAFQQMRGKAVTTRADGDAFADFSCGTGGTTERQAAFKGWIGCLPFWSRNNQCAGRASRQ
jgi:hypothetical protein